MQVDTKQEEIELLDFQIITTTFFIFALCISIFLSLNERYKLINGEPFLEDSKADALLKINRTFILFLFIVYWYINYKNREIDKINDKDLTPDNLEIFVSTLTVIGALTILYEVFKYSEYNSTYENPTI